MKRAVLAVAAAASIAGTGSIAAASAKKTSPPALAGHVFDFRVDDFTQPDGSKIHGLRFALAYSRDGEHVTFTKLGGNAQGPGCEVERIHVTRVGPGTYFIRWIEASGIAVSRVDNLVTGKVQLWFVLPTTLTGAPAPLTISPTGTIRAYTGPALPACSSTGPGT
jgi:hypothetical protein